MTAHRAPADPGSAADLADREPAGAGPAGAGARSAPTRRPATVRRRFRHWRRTRPFWGGLFVILGAAEILISVRAPLPVILHVGPQGLAGYLVPVVLLLCGVLLLANPRQRMFYAVVSVVLALVSWLTSNLGGFLVGMLLALLGASLAFAWAPRGTADRKDPPAAAEPGSGPVGREPVTTDRPDAAVADQ